MKLLMSLLVPVVSYFLSARQKEYTKRCLLTLIGFSLLPFAYILGCIGLYYYLVPYLGIAFSFLTLGGIILTTSVSFFLIGKSSKLRGSYLEESGSSSLPAKTFSQITNSPLPVVALLAIGIGAFYYAAVKHRK